MATLTCPMPENINPLSANGFLFNISKLPEVSFFCQQVNLPNITLGAPEQGTPFSMIPIPGEMITYGTLDLQFLIDENMSNFRSIYNWMTGLGFPVNNKQYSDFVATDTLNPRGELMKNYSDAVLQILNSSNNTSENKTIQFRDIFPVSLESLTMLATSTDVQYLVGSASFRISYYEFLA